MPSGLRGARARATASWPSGARAPDRRARREIARCPSRGQAPIPQAERMAAANSPGSISPAAASVTRTTGTLCTRQHEQRQIVDMPTRPGPGTARRRRPGRRGSGQPESDQRRPSGPARSPRRPRASAISPNSCCSWPKRNRHRRENVKVAGTAARGSGSVRKRIGRARRWLIARPGAAHRRGGRIRRRSACGEILSDCSSARSCLMIDRSSGGYSLPPTARYRTDNYAAVEERQLGGATPTCRRKA